VPSKDSDEIFSSTTRSFIFDFEDGFELLEDFESEILRGDFSDTCARFADRVRPSCFSFDLAFLFSSRFFCCSAASLS